MIGSERRFTFEKKTAMSYKCIRITQIEDSFSHFRLTIPSRIASMQSSLSTSGQLQPVVARSHGEGYQLLDGFKRYYAALALQWDSLECRVVEVDDIMAKTMLLTYNHYSGGPDSYEQAGIVHSLKKEHLLSETEIARLLNKSISWVSRRLSFIERLDECASTHLRLGHITSTHARELSRLPRGKQGAFLKLILDHGLTSRQSALLAGKYLQAKTPAQQEYLFSHPMEAIERATLEGEIYDCRLGNRGNRLLKTLHMLAHYQHVFIGNSSHPGLEEFSKGELEILSPGFSDIARKAQIIQSILKSYVHER